MKMLVCMFKSHLQTLIIKHQTLPNLNHCLIRPIFRSYSPKRTIDSSEFKISFLKNKCGLSGKHLIRASKCVHFDSSDHRPDSVLELFRNFGFPQPNITRIVSVVPCILQSLKPEKLLKPKLDFLLSMDMSHAMVVRTVTRDPRILARSLNKHLIPTFDQLKDIIGCGPNAVALLKCGPFIFTNTAAMLPNIRFLLRQGIPISQIFKFVSHYSRILCYPHDRFCQVFLMVEGMNFDYSSSHFIHALHALSFHNDSTWESRCLLLRSFGFSNDEVLEVFKKAPLIMCYKENHINKKVEFFLKKLQWTPSRLSCNPKVLCYSLEKRTIPRCSVLQVLVSISSTSKSYNLSTILSIDERKFVRDFVSVYKDELPEVMEAYQGKLKFDEYTFKQKGAVKFLAINY
ncbi:hypothetical protein DCAR_0104044 [Daucus carota subsp. sativus]|uniref:Uncharacterized protein n=1 Tax=Daucus carota subsp. sativus TaxID=79200 RepID=A0AAF0W7Z6_DAUCS|nr:PREDICTED: transcription termination factor MTERF8, chloroplastic-like [Daucus carota subsp. sativus]WOG84859.1 hypothetical protein DCAR_0104044 [Daucus carota subsp. sativus]